LNETTAGNGRGPDFYKQIRWVLLTNGELAKGCGYAPREEGFSGFQPCGLSPSGQVLLGRCAGSDDCFIALRLTEAWEDYAIGEYIGSCVNPLPFGLFQKGVWMEEHGFVKAVFWDFDSGEEAARRIVLDRGRYLAAREARRREEQS